jgi:O-antigen biosynthesis protein
VRPLLTVTTIVRDEAERLPDMIRSVRPVANEILCVDTGSVDGTPEIARQLGARVVHFAWCDDFAAARNRSLDAARGEWILVLDADDRLLPLGVTMVRRCLGWGRAKLRELGITGYSLCIDEQTLDGTSLGLATSSARLFPCQNSLRYVGRVHEEIHYLPDPSRAKWAIVEGVHVKHIGYDPSCMHGPDGKYARNERLLKMRLEDDPTDVWAMYYLAIQYRNQGDRELAAHWASGVLLLDDGHEVHGVRAEHTGRLVAEHHQSMQAILDRWLETQTPATAAAILRGPHR